MNLALKKVAPAWRELKCTSHVGPIRFPYKADHCVKQCSVRHAHEVRMGDTASCAWRTLLNIATLRTDSSSSTSLASSQWLSQAGQ